MEYNNSDMYSLSTSTEEEPIKYLKIEDYQKLLRVVKEKDGKRTRQLGEYKQDRNLIYMKLLWHMGARNGDIFDIKFSDVNFETNFISFRIHKVRHRMKKTKSGKLLPGKPYKEKGIYLKRNIIQEIQIFMYKYNLKPKDYIVGLNGRKMTTTAGWKLLKEYGQLIGLPELHPHMFRHGLAVLMLKNKVHPRVASSRLGHSNVLITMNIYQRISAEDEWASLSDINFGD
jgi:integrase